MRYWTSYELEKPLYLADELAELYGTVDKAEFPEFEGWLRDMERSGILYEHEGVLYEIHDSRGAPQCGCEITRFEFWWELEEYIDEHPDVYERIGEMYATIVERS